MMMPVRLVHQSPSAFFVAPPRVAFRSDKKKLRNDAMDMPGGFAGCRCCAFDFELEDDTAVVEKSRGDDANKLFEALPSDETIVKALEHLYRFDSHTHAQEVGGEILPENFGCCAQAVDEEDWPRVLEFCSRSALYAPALGVHPWQAHLVEDEGALVLRLKEALKEHPRAIVGEIGLCKCAKNVRGDKKQAGFAKQVSVFEVQLQVALELKRPVSVHAVKVNAPLRTAIAALHEKIRNDRIRIALHSFSGNAFHVRDLLTFSSVDLYFGFSYAVNVDMNLQNDTSNKKKAALYETIRAVPKDRLLVESDTNDLKTAKVHTDRAIALVAAARGWSLADAANTTARNALNWLGTAAVPPP